MPALPVMPGAEPFFADGNQVGCLVSHGFTGTPQSMRPLAEHLAREGGYTVSLPRLPGHGTDPSEMADSTALQWLQCLRGELQRLQERCESIFVVGLSMGGTLALHLAATHSDVVRGVITINAPVVLDSPELAALAFAADAPAVFPGIASDIKKAGAQELAYPVVPVPSLRELFGLVAAASALLPRIRCPLLAMQSTDDHVVPASNGPLLMSQVGSVDRRLVVLDDSFHVATLDNDAERIARESVRFIETYR
jgi:carboxylesterase